MTAEGEGSSVKQPIEIVNLVVLSASGDPSSDTLELRLGHESDGSVVVVVRTKWDQRLDFPLGNGVKVSLMPLDYYGPGDWRE